MVKEKKMVKEFFRKNREDLRSSHGNSLRVQTFPVDNEIFNVSNERERKKRFLKKSVGLQTQNEENFLIHLSK